MQNFLLVTVSTITWQKVILLNIVFEHVSFKTTLNLQMSGLLTSKYKPHVFADYDLQQPLDRQYKNLNLNKLHENYIRSNQGDLMFAESSQKTNHEKFNVQQSFRSTNEKWIKTTLDSKASKHSFFDEHLDHSTILSTNNNPGNVNSSTLSLHIAAYENLTEDSRVEETEGGFQTKPDKKVNLFSSVFIKKYIHMSFRKLLQKHGKLSNNFLAPKKHR